MKKEKQTISYSSKESGHSFWFLMVACLFTTCLITSNIIASKIIQISHMVLSAGIIIFPLSYIFGDILTEVYGYRQARRVIWLGFFCNLLTVVSIWAAGLLPPAPFWHGQEAYEQILGFTPRLLFASFVAYLVGEFTNSFVLAKMKIATKGKLLWTRTIGSTLIGQGFDSLVFMLVAFVGVMPIEHLFRAILAQWLLKSLYEALITPFTYLAVNFLKKRDKSDVYDHSTRFNPFIFSR